MASEQSGARRLDGSPETAADRRCFDMRESGYAGPVDPEGRNVTGGRAVEVLAAMRRRCK